MCGGDIFHEDGRMCPEIFLDEENLAILAKSGRNLDIYISEKVR